MWDFTSACSSREEYPYCCCNTRYRRLSLLLYYSRLPILLCSTSDYHYCCTAADYLILFLVLKLSPCAQQPWTQCAEPVSPAQHVPSPICFGGRDGAAIESSFGRPHAKHTRTELPSTRLPCSSFLHAPLGPMDLPVHFFK